MPRMVGRECGRSCGGDHEGGEIMDGMVNIKMVEGFVVPFALNKVEKTLEIMKISKTSRPTGFVKKHLVASLYKQVIFQIVNENLNEKAILHDWKISKFEPIYEGNGSVIEG